MPHRSTRDASTSDGSIADTAIPERSILEGSIPEASIPEGSIPEGSTPDGSIPEGSIPDGWIPEGSSSRASTPDATTRGASRLVGALHAAVRASAAPGQIVQRARPWRVGSSFARSCALALTAVLVSPQLYVYATGAHPLSVATESLAYRYFYAYRVWLDLPDRSFLPQGQLLDALGLALHAALDAWVPASEGLYRSTLLFGWGVFACNALIIWIALCIGGRASSEATAACARDGGHAPGILPVALLIAVGFYASRSGVNALLAPDYYALEVSLSALCLAWGFVWLRRPPSHSPITSGLLLGAMAGALLTTKITLAGALVFPLSVVIAAESGRLRERVARLITLAAVSAASAATTVIAVVLAATGLDLAGASEYARAWSGFLANPGGEEGFLYSLLAPWSPHANPGASYGYAVPVLAAAALACIGAARGSRARLAAQTSSSPLAGTALLGLPLLVAALHLIGLVHRPAGTTLWETALFAAALSLWALRLPSTTFVSSNVARGACAVSRALLIGTLVIGLPVNLRHVVGPAALRSSTEASWRAHHLALADGAGAIMLYPSNDHTAGTVGEALMKGASDFPSWDIAGGAPVIDRVAPGVEIRTKLDADVPGRALLWVDVAGAPSLAARIPALAARERAVTCERLRVESWSWWARTITVCPPIPEPGHAATPAR